MIPCIRHVTTRWSNDVRGGGLELGVQSAVNCSLDSVYLARILLD